jgi:DNA (cytosine-5)-methyltransferase 1
MGYDAKWGVLGAIHTGALHKRERIWIFAFNPNTKSLGSQGEPDAGITAISRPERKEQLERLHARQMGLALPAGNRGGITDGVANRMDRLKALGNGQVPAVVKLAWEELSK